RTAVAKHTSKTLRAAVILKVVVTLVCGVSGLFFLYEWMLDRQAYFPQAMGCLLMAGLIGAELSRNLLHLNRTANRMEGTGLNESTSSPPTDDDVPAEESDPDSEGIDDVDDEQASN